MTYLGQDIPKLGFGCMRFPKLEDGTSDIEHVKRMFDAFLAAGGKYVDTARAYGDSEATVRQALVERYPRESFYLATKNAAWLGAATREEACAFFDKSLEETGAGYFDFYLIHNTGDTRTAVFDKWDMWDFVAELKEQDKVRHIGFSHHGNAEELEELIEKHPQMEFVQLQVNYADWDNGNVQARKCVEVCVKHDMPIVIMEPVRGGSLANPPQAVADILNECDEEASPVKWALRFALGTPNLITVLSGMSSLEQMEDNLKIWQDYEPLDDAELEMLSRAQTKLNELTEVPCTACHYCMKDCPQQINIAGIMENINRVDIYNDGKPNVGDYNFATREGGKADDCIECGQCEEACPQHIPIIEKLAKAAAWYA